MAHGPIVTNWWYANASTSAAATVVATATLKDQVGGNLLIAIVAVSDTSNNSHPMSVNTPAGWALIDSVFGAGTASFESGGLAIYSFITTAGSPLSSLAVTANGNSGDTIAATILVIEFARYNATPVDQHGISVMTAITGGNISGPSKTPSQTNDTLLSISSMGSNSAKPLSVTRNSGEDVKNLFPSGSGNAKLGALIIEDDGVTTAFSGTGFAPQNGSEAAAATATLLLAPGTLGSWPGSASGGVTLVGADGGMRY